MIPLMEKEVVRLHSWLTLSQMADVVAISQMTPGPIAINLATFVGYKTAGLWGAFWATLGVVTPSFLIVLLIAKFYAKFRKLQVVQRIFRGMRPMVVALIGGAGFFIAQSSVIDFKTALFLVLSVIMIKVFKFSVLSVIFLSGVLGVLVFGVFSY